MSSLGIRKLVLAINKMDLVDYSEDTFNQIKADFDAFAETLGREVDITPIPMSALAGDNITAPQGNTDWYTGPSLIDYLETVEVGDRRDQGPFRMPVQRVNRPNLDFRGFSGTIVSGHVKPGDTLRVTPSGKEAVVERIVTMTGDLPEGVPGQSITLTLDREIDISRGDVLSSKDSPAEASSQFQARILWMSDQPKLPGRRNLVKMGTNTIPAPLNRPKFGIDINTLEEKPAKELELNEVGVTTLSLDKPIAFDPYDSVREMGGFILIDRVTNDTVGMGLVDFALRRASNIHWQAMDVTRDALAEQKAQKPAVLWFTGLSGSGKSTIANALQKKLYALGKHTFLLDGDNVRHGLNRDLGFTDSDRVENIRRVANVSKLMSDAGLLTLVSFISPFKSERRMARNLMAENEYIEIFVDTPLEVAEERDVKGLYKKARAGEIENFTGIDSPYEAPENAEIVINTVNKSPEDAADQILVWLESKGFLES